MPRNVSAAVGNQSLFISWITPTFENGRPILTYTVKATLTPAASVNVSTSLHTVSTVLPVGTLSTVLGGLINGKSYTVHVAASNLVGLGPFSNNTPPIIPSSMSQNSLSS